MLTKGFQSTEDFRLSFSLHSIKELKRCYQTVGIHSTGEPKLYHYITLKGALLNVKIQHEKH